MCSLEVTGWYELRALFCSSGYELRVESVDVDEGMDYSRVAGYLYLEEGCDFSGGRVGCG
jgi:hypothetical protein